MRGFVVGGCIKQRGLPEIVAAPEFYLTFIKTWTSLGETGQPTDKVFFILAKDNGKDYSSLGLTIGLMSM